MELKETFKYKFSFSQREVDNFAIVTGDDNPIHIDKEQASISIFKRRIMHGFLSGSVFSKVFGTLWPGNGTIYLSQNMKFIKPMYVGQEYLAKFEVIDILSKNRFLISTIIKNEENEDTIGGEAVIKYDKSPAPNNI
jgi:acyl dehydratase